MVAVGVSRRAGAASGGCTRNRPPGCGAHARLAAVHTALAIRGGRVELSARLHHRGERRLRRPRHLDFPAGRAARRHRLRLAAPRREAAAAPPVVSAEAAVRGKPSVGDGPGRGEFAARAGAPARGVGRGASLCAAAARTGDVRRHRTAGRHARGRRAGRLAGCACRQRPPPRRGLSACERTTAQAARLRLSGARRVYRLSGGRSFKRATKLRRSAIRIELVLLLTGACASVISAQRAADVQGIDPALFQDLRYRLVGPCRAGRTVGGMGVPSRPGVFYIGVNDGGVWKTDDYGRTWHPIFDSAPTGSIGDVAVAQSNPDIIYIGSGEGLHRPDLGVGDGIFKSDDGGRTWRHVGLDDVQQVGRVVVHPVNPDIVFVAGMGHPFGPNDQRGVFRTVDGGRSWDKVLFVDRNTGAAQVEIDPANPSIVYAALWSHREGPWENGSFAGQNSGL